MPRAHNGDVGLHYEATPPEGNGAWVAFLPEAGLGAWTWAWTVDAVAGPHGTLVVDPRGTGRSDAAPDAGAGDAHGLGTLAADLEAVLADAGVARAHLVGHGLGGATALRYDREYDRARGLALVATPDAGAAVDRAALSRLFDDDWPAVAFSAAYREAFPRERVEAWREADDAGPAARAALADAYAAFDPSPLYEVTTPALVLGPVASPVVPRTACERLADGLPRGRFEAVEGRHLAHAEHAVAVADRLVAFVESAGE